MSLGYADRLKNKRNLGGQLGAKEYHQNIDEINDSVKLLAKWVSDAKRVFVFTGAGISTSCGIPDFRGPSGIWTLRKKKIPIPTDFTPFEYAKPSFTHMAIAALVAAGKVPYVCSQNVDSLHLRSGVPRRQLAELHGNCFAERCTQCRTEYDRDFQMETVDFKPSGRRCCQPGCNSPLVDNILDWDTPLPEDELDEAVQQAEEADLALVLGTSLQIQPANEIPTLTRDEGGKMVIVNLQKTPKDRKANLIIRSKVDVVMALLMQELGMQVPPYIRTERLVVEHELVVAKAEPRVKAEEGGSAVGIAAVAASGNSVLTIRVRSRHGSGCPLPMVESLRISVTSVAGGDDRGGYGKGDDSGAGDSRRDAGSVAAVSWWHASSSDLLTSTSSSRNGGGGGGDFSHSFTNVPPGLQWVQCTLHVRLVEWADEDKRVVTLHHNLNLKELVHTASGQGEAAADFRGTISDADRPETSGRAICRDAPLPPSTTQVHSFTSQVLHYDPARVIANFLANPPIQHPDPPKKMKKQKAFARPDDAPAAVPPRASMRLASATRKAQPPSGSASSSDDLSSSANSDKS